MFSFLGVPVDAAYHLVSGLTGILTPVLGGLAAVAAIIVFTMAVRVLLMPLSLRALRGQAVQARLAPQLQALRQQHAKQPERLQREMAALYKREGTSCSPASPRCCCSGRSCRSCTCCSGRRRSAGRRTRCSPGTCSACRSACTGSAAPGAASAQGAVFLGVFALLAGLCWLSARLGRLMTAQAARPAGRAAPAGGPGCWPGCCRT